MKPKREDLPWHGKATEVDELYALGGLLRVTSDHTLRLIAIEGDALTLLGYSTEELLADLHKQRSLLSFRSHVQLQQALLHVTPSAPFLEEEIDVVHPSEGVRRFFVRGRGVFDHQGSLYRIEGIAMNITPAGAKHPFEKRRPAMESRPSLSGERADSFRKLYKLNRELARHSSSRDIATHILPILQAELIGWELSRYSP